MFWLTVFGNQELVSWTSYRSSLDDFRLTMRYGWIWVGVCCREEHVCVEAIQTLTSSPLSSLIVEVESLTLKLCIWVQIPGAQWPAGLTETL